MLQKYRLRSGTYSTALNWSLCIVCGGVCNLLFSKSKFSFLLRSAAFRRVSGCTPVRSACKTVVGSDRGHGLECFFNKNILNKNQQVL